MKSSERHTIAFRRELERTLDYKAPGEVEVMGLVRLTRHTALVLRRSRDGGEKRFPLAAKVINGTGQRSMKNFVADVCRWARGT